MQILCRCLEPHFGPFGLEHKNAASSLNQDHLVTDQQQGVMVSTEEIPNQLSEVDS